MLYILTPLYICVVKTSLKINKNNWEIYSTEFFLLHYEDRYK